MTIVRLICSLSHVRSLRSGDSPGLFLRPEASVTTRTPGLRGKLPVKPQGERFQIKYLHEYLSTPLPAPKYPVDVTGGIAKESWFMLGNGPDPTCTPHPDGVSDCGYAGREHYRMSKAACRGKKETPE